MISRKIFYHVLRSLSIRFVTLPVNAPFLSRYICISVALFFFLCMYAYLSDAYLSLPLLHSFYFLLFLPFSSVPLLTSQLLFRSNFLCLSLLQFLVKDFFLRRQMLMKRLDVTIQSFLWGEKGQGKEGEIVAAIRAQREYLSEIPTRYNVRNYYYCHYKSVINAFVGGHQSHLLESASYLYRFYFPSSFHGLMTSIVICLHT